MQRIRQFTQPMDRAVHAILPHIMGALVEPDGAQTQAVGAQHIDLKTITYHEDFLSRDLQIVQDILKEFWLGLALARILETVNSVDELVEIRPPQCRPDLGFIRIGSIRGDRQGPIGIKSSQHINRTGNGFNPWPIVHRTAELHEIPHQRVAPIEQDATLGVTQHDYLRPLGRTKGGSTAGLVRIP